MIGAAEFAWGLLFLAATTGSCLAAAWLLVRGRWAGAPLGLAFGVAASACVIAVHLLPGALGILTRGTALVAALLLLAAATRVRPPAHPPAPRAAPEEPRWLAWAAGLAVAACVLAFLRETAGTVVTGLDATTFHIPLVARFIETGSVWGLHQWLPDYSNATYPAHGNLLQLAAVLPFRHAFAATLVAVPFMGLAALAAYALARELGAGRAGAALAAAALAAVPDVSGVSLGTAVTDAPVLAFLGAGIVFGLRGDLLMAGLSLGLAAGTKWYGLSCAALLVVIWLVARRRWRGVPQAIGVGTAAGGFWLVRNWVETGNPLFPVRSPLFDAPPDLVREQGGFTIFDYATDWDVWDRYLLGAFERGFGWTGALLMIGAVAAAALARRGPVLAATAAAIGLVLVYFATPYSAFGGPGEPLLAGASTRYGLPALLAAAGATGWLVSRGGLPAQVVAAVAVADGLRRGFPDLSAGALIVGALLAAGAVALARAPRALALAAAVVLILGGAAILRERANDASYAAYSPVFAPLQDTRARVGLYGTWPLSDLAPVLPAFGERLRNDVDFLGRFEDGFLRRIPPAQLPARLRDLDWLLIGCEPACSGEREARAAGWRVVRRDTELVLLSAP